MLKYKTFKAHKNNKQILFNSPQSQNILFFIFLVIIFSFVTLRLSGRYISLTYNNIFFEFFIILIISYVCQALIINIKKTFSYEYIFLLLIFTIICANYINDFISLIILIEILASVYYFFFLKHSVVNYISFIKYKNLLSFYL